MQRDRTRSVRSIGWQQFRRGTRAQRRRRHYFFPPGEPAPSEPSRDSVAGSPQLGRELYLFLRPRCPALPDKIRRDRCEPPSFWDLTPRLARTTIALSSPNPLPRKTPRGRLFLRKRVPTT